jgi:hypothetical protein
MYDYEKIGCFVGSAAVFGLSVYGWAGIVRAVWAIL